MDSSIDFVSDKHEKFIDNLDKQDDTFEYWCSGKTFVIFKV